MPMEFPNVTAIAKANIYFEGKVVSHTLLFPGGSKKTLGVIFPGTYHFGTEAAELMEITDGDCGIVLDGREAEENYGAGQSFRIPAKSGFSVTVKNSPCQYVCSYLP